MCKNNLFQSITAICIGKGGRQRCAIKLTPHVPPHNAVHMSRLEAYLFIFFFSKGFFFSLAHRQIRRKEFLFETSVP